VALVSGEIAEDLSYYLTVSEQIPSAVALGVFVNPDNTVEAAGGFLIQTMPSATEEQISRTEGVIKKLPPVTSLLREGLSPEEILTKIFGEGEIQILEKRPLEYRCRCSRERVERALVALGPEELKELVRRKEPAKITCDFCGTVYLFEISELEQLLQEVEIRRRDELDA